MAAARDKKKAIDTGDFEYAVERVIAGKQNFLHAGVFKVVMKAVWGIKLKRQFVLYFSKLHRLSTHLYHDIKLKLEKVYLMNLTRLSEVFDSLIL